MIIEQLLNIDSLTNSEQIIAEYIEKNAKIVINLSLEELSNQCYVSQASIIRLCKKLGTKGFSDFKIKLAAELNSLLLDNQNIHVDVPINENDNLEDISDTLFQLSYHALENAYHNLDFRAIKKAAQKIAKADIVYIYGRGESLILAEDFYYKLIRIGKDASLDSLNGFQEARGISTSSKLNKVALIISQYCNSQQLHYIIDELNVNNIPYILVTAKLKAWPYDHFSFVTLRVPSQESRYKIGSFASRTALLYLLDCLYGQIFAYDYNKNRNNLTLFSKRKAERSYFYHSHDSLDKKD